jgi:predicted flap endonuclease-1-like 5' DNA nuclease
MQIQIRLIQDYAGSKIGDIQPASRISAQQMIDARIAVLASDPEPDDLTQIDGIGPARSLAMAEMGIRTFAALASADPAELDDHLDGTNAAQIADMQQAAAQRLETADHAE